MNKALTACEARMLARLEYAKELRKSSLSADDQRALGRLVNKGRAEEQNDILGRRRWVPARRKGAE